MQTTNKIEWMSTFQIPEQGRVVQVKDDCMTYTAVIPADMTMDEAAGDFAAAYDHNGESGAVRCYAILYVDGVDVAAQEFEA